MHYHLHHQDVVQINLFIYTPTESITINFLSSKKWFYKDNNIALKKIILVEFKGSNSKKSFIKYIIVIRSLMSMNCKQIKKKYQQFGMNVYMIKNNTGKVSKMVQIVIESCWNEKRILYNKRNLRNGCVLCDLSDFYVVF